MWTQTAQISVYKINIPLLLIKIKFSNKFADFSRTSDGKCQKPVNKQISVSVLYTAMSTNKTENNTNTLDSF